MPALNGFGNVPSILHMLSKPFCSAYFIGQGSIRKTHKYSYGEYPHSHAYTRISAHNPGRRLISAVFIRPLLRLGLGFLRTDLFCPSDFSRHLTHTAHGKCVGDTPRAFPAYTNLSDRPSSGLP